MREIDMRFFLDDEEPASLADTVPVPVDDKAPVPVVDASLAGKLKRTASTALDKLNEVLEIPLPDPSDPSFGNVSRAQSAAANTAIGAQLRVDETAMRARQGDDVMPRLLEILAREERKLAALEERASQVERDRSGGPNTMLHGGKDAERK
jgi:hypothetical protein